MTDQYTLNRAVSRARSPETRKAAVKAARAHSRRVAWWLRFWARQLPTLSAVGDDHACREARKLAQHGLRLDAEYAVKRGRTV